MLRSGDKEMVGVGEEKKYIKIRGVEKDLSDLCMPRNAFWDIRWPCKCLSRMGTELLVTLVDSLVGGRCDQIC